MTPLPRASIHERVGELLEAADYSPAARPLAIGGIPFERIDAYVAGAGFLDLVLVLDGGDGSAAKRAENFWLAERVGRALDSAGSRRPLTLILIDEGGSNSSAVEELVRLGRVLVIDSLDLVDVRLAPILPLVLEPTGDLHSDPLAGLLATGPERDRPFRARAIRAARVGEEPVVEEFERWLDAAFDDRERP